MDIFTHCDRCGANVEVTILTCAPKTTGIATKNSISIFIRDDENQPINRATKVLCDDCMAKFLSFLDSEKIREEAVKEANEAVKKYSSGCDKKLKKSDPLARNYISGITQDQVAWLLQNKRMSAAAFFKDIPNKHELLRCLRTFYGLFIVNDFIQRRLPSPDELIKEHEIDSKTAYAYRKVLVERGINPGGSSSPVKMVVKREPVDPKLYFDKKTRQVPKSEASKWNKLINKDLINNALTVSGLRKYGLQTVKDCVLYQPRKDDLTALDRFGDRCYQLYCNALIKEGVMDNNGNYKVFYNKAKDSYYEVI